MTGVIDAHLHVVDRTRVRPTADLAPAGAWWDRVDASAAAVLGRVRSSGTTRGVLVQAIGAHGYDCSVLVEAAAPGVALVGAVDPFGPDPVAELDALAADGVAGLRLFSIRSREPWLGGEVGRTLVARCIELEIRPSVCVLPDEIPTLVALAAAFPDTEFAVDHVAFASMDDHLKVLAGRENLCPTVTPTSGVTVAEAIDRFGRDRLSWGSDHPQHGVEYPAPIELPAAERLWFG